VRYRRFHWRYLLQSQPSCPFPRSVWERCHKVVESTWGDAVRKQPHAVAYASDSRDCRGYDSSAWYVVSLSVQAACAPHYGPRLYQWLSCIIVGQA
jgi:hypothetical protein